MVTLCSPPPPPCAAKATATVVINMTAIIKTTLRIQTLRFTLTFPPCAGGPALCVWMLPSRLRVLLPLADTSLRYYEGHFNSAHLPPGHFFEVPRRYTARTPASPKRTSSGHSNQPTSRGSLDRELRSVRYLTAVIRQARDRQFIYLSHTGKIASVLAIEHVGIQVVDLFLGVGLQRRFRVHQQT